MQNNTDKQTILIVDDMPINIQVLAMPFKSEYNVKIATNGEMALQVATSSNPPDLILLDIVMPDMDGYEVCKRLKRDSRTKNIPVIFITAKSEVEDETRGLELGAVDYITKPFQVPIVKARVKTHLNLKRKSDLLESLAALDALTEIANRRRFDESLQAEWNRDKRSKTPLTLIILDIDFFKNFNDNYGHAAGDDCLKRVAQALASSLKRPGDYIARYGGEEFAVILPGTDAKSAAHVAEQLISTVESLAIPHSYSDVSKHITISVGSATIIPNDELFPLFIVEAADKMLYEAKRTGRNKVCYHDFATEK